MGKRTEILRWMKKQNISMGLKEYYQIHNDKINFHGNFRLYTTEVELPYKFGVVEGDFYVQSNIITSLKNFPDYITGVLYIYDIPITTLEGFPKKVDNRIHLYFLKQLLNADELLLCDYLDIKTDNKIVCEIAKIKYKLLYEHI
jgi:hypothetical protein